MPESRPIPHELVFRGPGRPSLLARMIETSKMAWSPVLELLGRELKFEELDALPYPIEERIGDPLANSDVLSAAQRFMASRHSVRWLTADDVVSIHDNMIATFGGEFGVLHRGRVENALEVGLRSPISGHDPFPTIFQKAASVLHSILLYHPFVDGQKRTGISCAFIILGVNGFFMWSRDPGDEVHFAIHVAKGEIEVEQIARWIAARVVPPQTLLDPRVIAGLLPYALRRTRACSNCGHRMRLDSYRIVCSSCGAAFVATLNAGLVQRHGERSRLSVQVGVRRADRGPELQTTLDDYLARPEGSAFRFARPHS
jgi:death on curing protein